MATAQVQALAQELVDYITGEPKRFEEAQAARTKGRGDDANVRKSALVGEVAQKIDAIIQSETEGDYRATDATAPHSPTMAGHTPAEREQSRERETSAKK